MHFEYFKIMLRRYNMYKNLMAEIARFGLNKKQIADKLSIDRNTLNLKLKGKNAFTVPEVKKLLEIFKPNTFEYLFNKE